MFKLNRKEKRNKKANFVANWVVNTILKLPTQELIQFYELIAKELQRRSDKNV